MENLARNEMLIELGAEKILLRPTFENLSAMESKLGGMASLTFKYAKNVDGFDDVSKIDVEKMSKSFPSFSEATQIIYYNQAEKKFTLEQIHELVMETGVKGLVQVVTFLVRATMGSKKTKLTSSKKKG
jgi:hypothetical protein